jgi:hypothetical protein
MPRKKLHIEKSHVKPIKGYYYRSAAFTVVTKTATGLV